MYHDLTYISSFPGFKEGSSVKWCTFLNYNIWRNIMICTCIAIMPKTIVLSFWKHSALPSRFQEGKNTKLIQENILIRCSYFLSEDIWKPLTILATRETLYLLEEDHQWRKSSSSAAVNANKEASSGGVTVLDTLPLSCVSSVHLWPSDECRMDIQLYDEASAATFSPGLFEREAAILKTTKVSDWWWMIRDCCAREQLCKAGWPAQDELC